VSRFGRRYARGGGIGSLLLLLLVALVVFGDDDSGSGGGGESEGELPRSVSARVTRVVDGDTIEVLIRGREEDVRYIGVDTPETVAPGEPVRCFGPRASAFNHRLVDGRTVRLVFDAERRDVYGRLLAYVYLGRLFVNATLVRRGLARTLTIAPNDSFAALFERLERAAGRSGRGLWGACSP
jgi:micrococcal nuclease